MIFAGACMRKIGKFAVSESKRANKTGQQIGGAKWMASILSPFNLDLQVQCGWKFRRSRSSCESMPYDCLSCAGDVSSANRTFSMAKNSLGNERIAHQLTHPSRSSWREKLPTKITFTCFNLTRNRCSWRWCWRMRWWERLYQIIINLFLVSSN